MTRKFIDGMLEYMKYWPGSATVMAEADDRPNNNLDNIEVRPSDLPFDIVTMDWSDPSIDNVLRTASIVSCSLDDWKQLHIPEICRRIGVPVVCVIEYTLRTRRQIIASGTSNPVLRLRRYLWASRMERRRRKAIRLAAGLQCNGTPAYHLYGKLNCNPMLYFDNRSNQSMLASDATIANRTRHLIDGRPIRLAFSGRLAAMKGVNHLPRVANELRQSGVPFSLEIFGDGPLKQTIQQELTAINLLQNVHLRGTLDFATELIPTLTESVDLFVCCHPQGDPSCTYLETMACGLPIVGYANEAFAGMVEMSGVGVASPINKPEFLARAIVDLNRGRPSLCQASLQARDFASRHTFEQTFLARVRHLISASDAH
ncbi:MAG: glycosyltransferase family 4 protein [Planctomycetes bacterium]|nr:glycosyltransferase family 4 protein [Planctomycetota bacterium]